MTRFEIDEPGKYEEFILINAIFLRFERILEFMELLSRQDLACRGVIWCGSPPPPPQLGGI